MGNTSHSLNSSESHAIKGHFYTKLFNIRTITRRTGAISKLTATLTAKITLFSLTMTIFHYFMALTGFDNKDNLSLNKILEYHSLLCNTQIYCPNQWGCSAINLLWHLYFELNNLNLSFNTLLISKYRVNLWLFNEKFNLSAIVPG